MPVETLPTDSESLIRIWRPQAVQRAEQGESEFAIARFLHSKGVEGAAARQAARELVGQPGPAAHSFASGLGKTIGIILLLLGLVVPVACFVCQWSGLVTVAALMGSLVGIAAAGKLLWPG